MCGQADIGVIALAREHTWLHFELHKDACKDNRDNEQVQLMIYSINELTPS